MAEMSALGASGPVNTARPCPTFGRLPVIRQSVRQPALTTAFRTHSLPDGFPDGARVRDGAGRLREGLDGIAQGLTVREAAARIKVSKTALYAALGEEAANASDLSA
jgi:hypothetical protein